WRAIDRERIRDCIVCQKIERPAAAVAYSQPHATNDNPAGWRGRRTPVIRDTRYFLAFSSAAFSSADLVLVEDLVVVFSSGLAAVFSSAVLVDLALVFSSVAFAGFVLGFSSDAFAVLVLAFSSAALVFASLAFALSSAALAFASLAFALSSAAFSLAFVL